MRRSFLVEEDILTIPDNLSDVRSLRTGLIREQVPQPAFSEISGRPLTQKRTGADPLEGIPEEEYKEGDEPSMRPSHPSRSHLRVAKDTTLRSRLKRCCYRILRPLRQFFSRAISTLIIHSSTVGLACIFLASMMFASVFNALLFIVFLICSVLSYEQLTRLWSVPILLTCYILVSIYCFDVFIGTDRISEMSDTMQLWCTIIGLITPYSTDDFYPVDKYISYVSLLFVLILT